MGHTITVRLTRDLAEWLERTAAETGRSQGQIIRDHLEQRRARKTGRTFMRLAGALKGPRNLSTRKGFSRP
jgi:hypothetical protein